MRVVRLGDALVGGTQFGLELVPGLFFKDGKFHRTRVSTADPRKAIIIFSKTQMTAFPLRDAE